MGYPTILHKIAQVGWDHRKSVIQPPAQGWVSWGQARLLRGLSSLDLKTCKDRACKTGYTLI